MVGSFVSLLLMVYGSQPEASSLGRRWQSNTFIANRSRDVAFA
jgi:hypothetical protein